MIELETADCADDVIPYFLNWLRGFRSLLEGPDHALQLLTAALRCCSTGINLTSAGIGYTNTPSIIIAPPPAAALRPNVTQVMRLDFGGLSPYDNYQLELTQVAGGIWSNFHISFTPTSPTDMQLIDPPGELGFFRLRYVP